MNRIQATSQENQSLLAQRSFTRRTMLRGVGVTMALPFLESVSLWADEKSQANQSTPPVRTAVLFSGNGFHNQEWWARGAGDQLELGRVLAPLNSLKNKMLFISGLYNAEALKGNIHSSQTGNLLSGAPLASGGEIRSGTSFDQLIAQHQGRLTYFLELSLYTDTVRALSCVGIRSIVQGRSFAG